MAVSRRLRYEALRRDNHACRYCGATAPDAKLTVDHVIPVALGGSDDPSNLVTACQPCNAGKSASSPDAPVVDDVSRKALEWAEAIKRAAVEATKDYERRIKTHASFANCWGNYTYGPDWNRQQVPLPDGWESSIDNFVAAGLNGPLLTESIRIAMSSQAAIDDKFSYFCGVCWRKIRALQEVAFDEMKGRPDGA